MSCVAIVAACWARDGCTNGGGQQRDWLLEVTAHREMEAFDRAIDLRITRLRRTIEPDPTHPDAIRTVRGVGYMFVPPTG
jgi:DNA-binding response OmpR family regulator